MCAATTEMQAGPRRGADHRRGRRNRAAPVRARRPAPARGAERLRPVRPAGTREACAGAGRAWQPEAARPRARPARPTRAPGTAAWAQMDMHARSRWWVRRVGRVTSLVAAVPGFGGAVTSTLPVSRGLGAAAQGLVLCAIADEHDMHDEADVVALLGAVMFRRDLCPPARPSSSRASDAAVDARAAELTGGLENEKKPTLQRLGGALWRMGRGAAGARGRARRSARAAAGSPAGSRCSRWSGWRASTSASGRG